MPRYKIKADMGFVGATLEDEIEADNQEEADEIAWDFAVERVSVSAELIVEEDEHE